MLVCLHSEQGKNVVRLKGGCPSTFSRVGSELKALAAAGIPHEMVPGVSSALAAPILAGAALLACPHANACACILTPPHAFAYTHTLPVAMPKDGWGHLPSTRSPPPPPPPLTRTFSVEPVSKDKQLLQVCLF